MKCQHDDKLIKDTNIYPGFYCYILVLKCSIFFFNTSTISTERLPNVFFFFLSRRDLKPENILLDDRGMFQFYSFPFCFTIKVRVWAHFRLLFIFRRCFHVNCMSQVTRQTTSL